MRKLYKILLACAGVAGTLTAWDTDRHPGAADPTKLPGGDRRRTEARPQGQRYHPHLVHMEERHS